MTKRNKKVKRLWNLSQEEVTQLIMHVGDHAGAQGHAKNHLQDGHCCPECYALMKKLFPKNW